MYVFYYLKIIFNKTTVSLSGSYYLYDPYFLIAYLIISNKMITAISL
jgi:hypothetical protein